MSPGLTIITAEDRTDGVRFVAICIGDANGAIGKADHRGGIAAILAVFFNGIGQPLKAQAAVPRAEQLDEIVLGRVVVPAAQGHEEISVSHANRRGHNRIAAGRLKPDPGKLVEVSACGPGARAKWAAVS